MVVTVLCCGKEKKKEKSAKLRKTQALKRCGTQLIKEGLVS